MATNTERNYEAMVIINSIMADDEIQALIDKLGKLLESGGATLKETARWGRRRLAYEIKKRVEGYYVIYYFTLGGSAEVLTALEKTCRYDENILRHMVVNVPTRKRGQEIAQIVPSPGWLSEYQFTARPSRRREQERPVQPQEVAAPAAVAEAVPAEAAPAESEQPTA